MSKTIKLFFGIIILMSIIVSTGCDKDDEDENDKIPEVVVVNHITYDGTEYKLTEGTIENYGEMTGVGSYNNDLMLFSGYTVHETDGEIDSLSGTGYLLYMEMFSTQGEKFDIGDYLYDADETYAVKTFDMGTLLVNYNILNDDGLETEIVSGKLSILSNGAEYEISFSGTDDKDKAITAYFKGSLKYYDYSSKSVDTKKRNLFRK